MLDLLVKKNEYNQLVVLGAALSSKRKSASELQEQLNISKSSFNRYLNTLNGDLNQLFNEEFQLISDDYHLKLITPVGTNVENQNIFMKTLTHYIHQSTSFHILMLLSHEDELKVEDVLDVLHISYSYFNKLIKEINHYMWHTSVTLTQKNKLLKLEGSAANLTVFKIGLKLALWRFDSRYAQLLNSESELQYYNLTYLKGLNSLQKGRLKHIENTMVLMQQDHLVFSNSDGEVAELLTTLTAYKNLIKPTQTPYSEDTTLFLNLITRILCPQIDRIQDRVTLAKLFLTHTNSIVQDSLILLNFIQGELIPLVTVGSDDYYHYIYQSVMTFLYLRLLNYNFTDLFTMRTDRVADFYIYEQPAFKKIKDELTYRIPFTNDKNKLIFIQNQMLFSSGAYTALRGTKTACLNLFVDFKYQLGFEIHLKKRLAAFFSKSTIQYVDDITQSDILITDSFIAAPEDKAIFVFVDINSVHAMEDLMVKLTKLYTNKLKVN